MTDTENVSPHPTNEEDNREVKRYKPSTETNCPPTNTDPSVNPVDDNEVDGQEHESFSNKKRKKLSDGHEVCHTGGLCDGIAFANHVATSPSTVEDTISLPPESPSLGCNDSGDTSDMGGSTEVVGYEDQQGLVKNSVIFEANLMDQKYLELAYLNLRYI